MPHKYTNHLEHESSPYLLQHAHNPVDWYPWGDESLDKAKKEGKLLLISIGYAACHWCHVMEHESFEDEQVAEIMNENFVCIKVDREERPDIDHIYMTAVQLMTRHGGWPLNCIALPDGRPIWGGTYFPKENWVQTLITIADFYRNEKDKAEEYAAQLQNGIVQSALVQVQNEKENLEFRKVESAAAKWKTYLDFIEGGNDGAPKFMLPNNLLFLLRYGHQQNDEELLSYIQTTLEKMAFGGIYDHIGGGFARYSVDAHWKVPHFEKMLYDNAQLLSLYSQAYQKFKNPLYENVVNEIIGFVKREMTSPEFGFYSSLDADSEGEEGKFYVWGKEELLALLGEEFNLFSDYFNVNNHGYWEHGNYILLRKHSDSKIAEKHGLDVFQLQKKVRKWKILLLQEREKRIVPGLDNKILASWNALMNKGLVDAYKAFGKKEFLDLAIKNADFLSGNMIKTDGSMFHSFNNNQAKVDAFLEDYAFTVQAFIALFETIGNEDYLQSAAQLTEYTFEHFFDAQLGIFYFTSNNQKGLISKTIEVHDNVIPASNSVMAINLFKLGHLLYKPFYGMISKDMLAIVAKGIQDYPSGHSNWLQHYLNYTNNHYELAISGTGAKAMNQQIQKHYLPNVLFCISKEESDLPLLRQRFVADKTHAYVCENNSCQLPVEDISEVLQLIK